MTPREFDLGAADLTWLTRLAHSLANDPNEAEDLVQESYLLAVSRPPKSGEVTKGWLSTVMRNLHRLRHRRNRRRRKREERVARSEVIPQGEHLIERLELAEIVLKEVRELEPIYQEVILLRYHWDLGCAEIAERMDVPESTVRTRLRRAEEQLRARLEARSRRGMPVLLAPLLWRASPPAAASAAIAIGGILLMKKAIVWTGVVIAVVLAALGAKSWWGSDEGANGDRTHGVAGTESERAVEPGAGEVPSLPVESPAAVETAMATVTIVDAITGEPLAGAALGTVEDRDQYGRSGEDGGIEVEAALFLDVRRDAPRFVVSLDGFAPRAMDKLEARVGIQPGFELRGRVVGGDGSGTAETSAVVLESPEIRAPSMLTSAGLAASRTVGDFKSSQALMTDAEGRFRTWTSSNSVVVKASHPSHRMTVSPVYARSPSGFPEITITLAPAFVLEGEVRDTEGAPIVGAEVHARSFAHREDPTLDYHSSGYVSTLTDESGRFALEGLAETHTGFYVTCSGYRPYPGVTRIGEAPVPTAEFLTVVLEPGLCFVGRFQPRTGVSLPDRVVLRPGDQVRGLEGVIQSDGAFEIRPEYPLSETSGKLWVAGFLPVSVGWSFPDELAVPIDLGEVQLDPGLTRRLVVVDDLGEPWVHRVLRVGVSEDARMRTLEGERYVTDVNGECVVSGLPSAPVQLEVEGLIDARQDWDVVGGGDPYRLVVPRPGVVKGHVVDPQGQPVPGATIRCPYPDPRAFRNQSEITVYTTPSGAFRMEGVPTGQPLTINTGGAGVPYGTVAVEPLAPGEVRDVDTIRAGGERRVSGFVRDDAGGPVPGATVSLGGYDMPSYIATTDGAGAFRFENLADAKFQIAAAAAGHLPARQTSVTLSGDDVAGLEITLTPATTWSGTVVDASGAPIEGATVHLMSMRTGTSNDHGQVVTDRHGRYLHTRAPTSKVMMRCSHPDYLGSRAFYDQLESMPDPMVLEKGATLMVRLTTPDGTLEGTPHFNLSRHRQRARGGSQRTDDPMVWVIPALEPGSWSVAVELYGRPPSLPVSVELVRGETASVTIDLGPRLQPFELRVVDLEQVPVFGARVGPRSNFYRGVTGQQRFTDEDGRATFDVGILPDDPFVVAKEGFTPVLIEPDDVRGGRAEVVLEPESALRIRALDADGELLTGVSLEIESWSLGFQRLRGEPLRGGTTTIGELAPGTYDVVARLDRQAIGRETIELGPHEVRDIEFRQEVPRRIDGRVLVDGASATGGTLRFARPWLMDTQTTQVDTTGRYTILLHGTGRFDLRYEAESGESREREILVAEDEVELDVAFDGRRVSFLVLDPEGTPVPGVSASVSGLGGERITTDDDGRASVAGLEAGEYVWSVRSVPGDLYGAPRRFMLIDDMEIVITLERARRLSMRFTGPTPERWYASVLRDGRTEPTRIWERETEDLRWPAAATRGVVHADGFVPFVFDVTSEGTVDVDLKPGGRLEVFVLAEDGMRFPHRKFRVTRVGLERDDPESMALETHSSDRYGSKVLYLDPGEYEVRFVDLEAEPVWAVVDLEGSTTVKLVASE